MSSQGIGFEDIYQQLSVFGYSRNEINEAIQNVTNNLDINSILDYIFQNQSTVRVLSNKSIIILQLLQPQFHLQLIKRSFVPMEYV